MPPTHVAGHYKPQSRIDAWSEERTTFSMTRRTALVALSIIVVDDRFFSRSASESGHSRGGTEGDPVGPLLSHGKQLSWAISSNSTSANEKYVNHTETFSSSPRSRSRRCRSQTKSSISSKSCRHKAVGPHVALSAAHGAQDRPQLSGVSWRFPGLNAPQSQARSVERKTGSSRSVPHS